MNRFVRQRRRLAWVLGIVFAALLIGSAVLVMQAFSRLRFEAAHGQRVLAEEMVSRVNAELARLIAAEEGRPPTDYDYLVVSGERYVQRSPLSSLSPETSLPGVIGFFQVDADGRFSTPLLPVMVSDPGTLELTHEEVAERRARQDRLRRLLDRDRTEPVEALVVSAGRLASARERAPAAPSAERPRFGGREEADGTGSGPDGRNIFEKLNQADVASRSADVPSKAADREVRQVVLDEPEVDEPITPRIAAFTSAVDPLSLAWLDPFHLVLYRKVWLEGQLIQGVVLEQRAFVDAVIGRAFTGTSLSRHAKLTLAFEDRTLRIYPAHGAVADDVGGLAASDDVLLRAQLAAPAGDLVLTFSVVALPLGPGAATVMWAAVTMTLVLGAGLVVLYRLGRHHIDLAEQQQDFVAAISHELKTPLTSIRMYGEILKAGWADEARKQSYYDYILSESERLSRLIGNVLQLARMTHRDPRPAVLKAVPPGRLLDVLESKIASSIEEAGISLVCARETGIADVAVMADEDAFLQVMINLVDNAIKFSRHAERRVLELDCRLEGGWVEFRVRDYGPGVPKGQMKKIFELFYRGENELTRETVGTGIGLALVHALVRQMGGSVDVVNRQPGAEFRVRLRRASGRREDVREHSV